LLFGGSAFVFLFLTVLSLALVEVVKGVGLKEANEMNNDALQ